MNAAKRRSNTTLVLGLILTGLGLTSLIVVIWGVVTVGSAGDGVDLSTEKFPLTVPGTTVVQLKPGDHSFWAQHGGPIDGRTLDLPDTPPEVTWTVTGPSGRQAVTPDKFGSSRMTINDRDYVSHGSLSVTGPGEHTIVAVAADPDPGEPAADQYAFTLERSNLEDIAKVAGTGLLGGSGICCGAVAALLLGVPGMILLLVRLLDRSHRE